MKFYSEIMLPESQQSCKISQITFEEYLTLNRFLQNNVNSHIEEYIFELLKLHTSHTHFTAIDATAALIFLRIISIGPVLNLKSNKIEYRHDLVKLLQDLCDLKLPTSIVEYNDITINIKTPFKLFDITEEDFVYSATIDSKEYFFSATERREIVSQLPVNIIEQIQQFIEDVEHKIQKIIFKIVETDVKCSVVEETLGEFVKIIFKDSIKSCQRRLISIASNTELNAQYVLSIPPAEVEMIMAFIEEQEASNKPQAAPNIPMNPMPSVA